MFKNNSLNSELIAYSERLVADFEKHVVYTNFNTKLDFHFEMPEMNTSDDWTRSNPV